MIRKAGQLLVVIIGTIIIFLLLRPVSIDADSSTAVEGIVENIEENAHLDIVLTLRDNTGSYYINRGLETQFKPGELQSKLNGKHVAILYADQWGSLSSSMKHILQLSADGKELYTELHTNF